MSEFSNIPDGKNPMTHEAQREFYRSLPDEKKAPALQLLRDKIDLRGQEEMRIAIRKSPEDWYVMGHFYFGMSVRNFLREHGFGEDYWPIWNLDDIYVHLLEEAIR